MKMISVKIHTDVVVLVSDDYDIDDPDIIGTIAGGVMQDLISVFDDQMITTRRVKIVQHIPSDYLDVEPWVGPDVDVTKYGNLTCKQFIEYNLCNME
ncbi:hypothetical protein LCGC14_1130290 [marine sediment metagenome]|uniref:Uncharacterized protein n=1 Tax=marine sediment metagenome TaxID=412755 RepID=A0A0F9Q714_9ZZZZ